MCKSSHVKDKHFYFSSHFFKNLENLCPHFSSGHFLAFLNDELALNDLTFNDRPDKLKCLSRFRHYLVHIGVNHSQVPSLLKTIDGNIRCVS